MGSKSSSSSATTTTTTTDTQNLNLQGTSGTTIAGRSITVNATDAAALQAVNKALGTADDGVSAAANVTLAALAIYDELNRRALQGAKDFAEATQGAAFEFAGRAAEPGAGAAVEIVKWTALGAVALIGWAWFARGTR